ncbi:MAG: DUF3783 domain-containing protein [Thermoplasmata archaeon]|nr:DUF3783 domain-containing protein [Thermoplasmata archaeon]
MILLIGFREDEVERIEEAMGEEVFSIGEVGLTRELGEVVKSPQRYSGFADVGGRYLIVHSAPGGRLGEIIQTVKMVVEGDVIPATTTPTSLKWVVKDLLQELKKEHEYFKSLKK